MGLKFSRWCWDDPSNIANATRLAQSEGVKHHLLEHQMQNKNNGGVNGAWSRAWAENVANNY